MTLSLTWTGVLHSEGPDERIFRCEFHFQADISSI